MTCSCVDPSPHPITTRPINVICDQFGDCSCPVGTDRECIITCDATTDSCKDGTIKCNNNGFDCIVNCFGENSCSGLTKIIGPDQAALTVNCIGMKSCDG